MAGASSFSSSSTNASLIPTGPQVFINFRGELRKGFISFLVPALKEKNINVFIDEHESRGKYLISLFERIGESKLALVVFSEGYTESKWCLDELVQIKKCMDQDTLIVIPIFYKLDPAEVKRLKGKFGDKFRDLEDKYQHTPERPQRWKEAMISVCQTFALSLPKYSDTSDKDFIRKIVKEVRKVLTNISKGRNGKIRENDVDGCSVPASTLTISMRAKPGKEAVEVSVLNDFYCPNNMTEDYQRNQLLGPSYEFKFWLLERPEGNVFTIDARELSIAWSEDSNYWTWLDLPDQNPNELVEEIACLKEVCWLDVAGKFDTRYLSPRTRYEVVFVVMLENSTFEWETPVKLKLVLPSSSRDQNVPQEWSLDMADLITDQWIDIPVGEFTTSKKNVGEISFAMYEHECQLWKSGLYVKGVVIRPKH